MREAAARTGYARDAQRGIVVPAGPDGRPGESVVARSTSVHPPHPLGPDGSRQDFRVLVTERTSFGAVCLGPAAGADEPLNDAYRSLAAMAGRGLLAGRSQVLEEEVAGGPGIHYAVRLRSGLTLLEWKFAHAGWLFTAGAAEPRKEDRDEVLAASRELLASWTWIEDGAPATGPSPGSSAVSPVP